MRKSLISRCWDVFLWFDRNLRYHCPLSLTACSRDLGLSLSYVSYIVHSSQFARLHPSTRSAILKDIYNRRCHQCADMRSRKGVA